MLFFQSLQYPMKGSPDRASLLECWFTDPYSQENAVSLIYSNPGLTKEVESADSWQESEWWVQLFI